MAASAGLPAANCRLVLRASLHGHREAVTCLAASDAFSLLVTGSSDRRCLLWDLGRLCLLRQLGGHEAPVAAVCINEATGELVSCAGARISLWTVNGDPVASVEAPLEPNRQILCVTMSSVGIPWWFLCLALSRH
ncbi:unnamed protein product [Protopolystoma xenopodis]|uniref:Uncharacterized protein n=1 Tax=Protopolystoma xenopodis TaxID=117903 RepID=A0A3S5BWN9_9PLAT|nr:unnamed protein product [Protopolystoma xenopodis]